MPLLPSQVATCDRHYEREPSRVPGETCSTWITRGANFIVAVSQVEPGDTMERDTPDESVLLLPDTPGLAVDIEAGGESLRAAEDSLTILPPGRSRLRARSGGVIARVFSSDVTDLLPLAANRETYQAPNPDVAPLLAWPAPCDGYRLRHYRLKEHLTEGSQMRIFRTAKLMVNPLLVRTAPRDMHRLSPHSHADFEQGSLVLSGTYIHHLRYPWGPDMASWRDDEAVRMAGPSLLVVPPKVVHTSRNIDAPGVLIDIFAPPRLDFSNRGIVRNGDEYPMPDTLPLTA